MKKLLYTFLAVSIAFSACKKEDEDITNNNSASVIGIWTIISCDIEGQDTIIIGASPELLGVPTMIEFVQGGILYEGYMGSSSFSDTSVWEFIGDSIYIGDSGEDFIGKHSVTSTNLTLKGRITQDNEALTINGTRN